MASSPNGYGYITQIYVLFETTLGGTPACPMYYNLVGNYVVLIDDAGGWSMSHHLATPGTLHNSQCTLDYGASSATGSSNSLMLNLALTFNAAWTGTKSNYLYVGDRGNHTAGWTQMGAWTVGAAAHPPVNVSVSPSAGSGLGPQTFAFTSSPVNGSGYIPGCRQ